MKLKNPMKLFAKGKPVKAAVWQEAEEKSYAAQYDEAKLWQKIGKNFQAIGVKLAYKALQLFYVTKNPKCPARIKAGIYGALGYLIVPFDAVADFLPWLGYTDDLTIIAGTLLLAHLYINEEVREKAREKVVWLFGKEALTQLEE